MANQPTPRHRIQTTVSEYGTTAHVEMGIDHTDGYRVVVEWEDGEGACWQASLAGLNEVNQGRMTQTCAMGFGATKEAALLDLCVALAATLDSFSDAVLAQVQEWGRKGGNARAKKLTKEQRSEVARKAANARWGKKP